MYIVYFETNVNAKIIGLMTEDAYEASYHALGKWAANNGGFITESLIDDDSSIQSIFIDCAGGESKWQLKIK